MRRHLILVSILIGTVACAGQGTEVEATIINVVVRDDRGVPVNRMPVSAIISPTGRVDASTRTDGTVQLRVPDGGIYVVRVTARAGYIGSTPDLIKSVSVDANATATVDFTVYRQGVSTGDPTIER